MLERERESILVFSLAWLCLFVPVICPVYSNVLPFTIYIYISCFGYQKNKKLDRYKALSYTKPSNNASIFMLMAEPTPACLM